MFSFSDARDRFILPVTSPPPIARPIIEARTLNDVANVPVGRALTVKHRPSGKYLLPADVLDFLFRGSITG